MLRRYRLRPLAAPKKVRVSFEVARGPERRSPYHHTSAVGLIGIIQAHEIWATNIHYLNDAQEFQSRFVEVAPLIKHPSFAEEREWRLFSGPKSFENRAWGFRPGTTAIIPYYRLPLGGKEAGPIFQVRVGPTPDSELAFHALAELVRFAGLRVQIARSV